MKVPLRCPCCGSALVAVMEWRGSAWMQEQFFAGMECDNLDCCAEWDRKGEMTTESRVDTSGHERLGSST